MGSSLQSFPASSGGIYKLLVPFSIPELGQLPLASPSCVARGKVLRSSALHGVLSPFVWATLASCRCQGMPPSSGTSQQLSPPSPSPRPGRLLQSAAERHLRRPSAKRRSVGSSTTEVTYTGAPPALLLSWGALEGRMAPAAPPHPGCYLLVLAWSSPERSPGTFAFSPPC